MTRIFQSVLATLTSEQIKEISPEDTWNNYLEQIKASNDLSFHYQYDEDMECHSISTDIQTLVLLYKLFCDKLQVNFDTVYSHLHPSAKSTTETTDKGINCTLLKPQFSRFGRLISSNIISDTISNISLDDEENLDDDSDLDDDDVNKGDQIDNENARSNENIEDGRSTQQQFDGKVSETHIVLTSPHEAMTETHILMTSQHQDELMSSQMKNVKTDSVTKIINMGEDHADNSGKENEATEHTETNELIEPVRNVQRYKCKTLKASSMAEHDKLHVRKRKMVNPIRKYSSITKPAYKPPDNVSYKFSCKLCSFSTDRPSHIAKHNKLHGKDTAIMECDKCSFKTIKKTHLGRHETLYHSPVTMRCDQCEYTTGHNHLLEKHKLLRHHRMVKRPLSKEQVEYSCNICGYKTTKKFRLERHHKRHTDVVNSTNTPVKDYICHYEGCKYITQKKDRFLRHLQNVHSDKRPFMCEECGTFFKRKDALKQHKLVHTDQTERSRILPFRCVQCPEVKGFRSKAHLLEHMSSHSNVRPYLCEICGASFKTKSVQRKHVLSIHKNPGSFKCDKCDKCFNTKYTMVRHTRLHQALEERERKPELELAAQEDTAPPGVQYYIPQLHQVQITGSDGSKKAVQLETDLQQLQQGSTVQFSGIDENGQQVIVVAPPVLSDEHMQQASDMISLGNNFAVTDSDMKGVTLSDPVTQDAPFLQSNETTTALLYLTHNLTPNLDWDPSKTSQ